MTLRIFGAGMAGLLAADMLRRHHPIVCEAQSALPDNHGALLRFRSDVVAKETRQDFRKVRVFKAVKSGGRLRPVATIRDANQYSKKVTGSISPRSVLNLEPVDRWIAPENFVSAMARDATIKLNAPLDGKMLADLKGQRDVATISTIPMPVLMRMVGWDVPGFSWHPVWSSSIWIEDPVIDVYQTIYYPEPDAPHYRASITGRQLILEFMSEPTTRDVSEAAESAIDDFGLEYAKMERGALKRQEYGKILPMQRDDIRREFIVAMTDQYNVYSLGRFATWRQILLDDVAADVWHVERMMDEKDNYARRMTLNRFGS